MPSVAQQIGDLHLARELDGKRREFAQVVRYFLLGRHGAAHAADLAAALVADISSVHITSRFSTPKRPALDIKSIPASDSRFLKGLSTPAPILDALTIARRLKGVVPYEMTFTGYPVPMAIERRAEWLPYFAGFCSKALHTAQWLSSSVCQQPLVARALCKARTERGSINAADVPSFARPLCQPEQCNDDQQDVVAAVVGVEVDAATEMKGGRECLA
jgi:hypothetical protein